MEFKQTNEFYVLRLEHGEDIVKSLMEFAEMEEIKLGSISGIGAVEQMDVGLYDPSDKTYHLNSFVGDFEMANLTGNLTTFNGDPYVHVHATFADSRGKTIGGHLNRAIISATAEIFIITSNTVVDRNFSEEIGLNLLDLS